MTYPKQYLPIGILLVVFGSTVTVLEKYSIPTRAERVIIILDISIFIFLAFLQGHIFAADNKYYGYLIPTIGHSVVINILNKLYRSVANFCTDLENHR